MEEDPVGNHYVPKYYLRGFSQDGRNIFVYDKSELRKFGTQIKSIANICGLYPPDLEKYLSEKIEAPANMAIEKVRNRGRLTRNEKITLSSYIAAMWKRVPEGESRVKRQAPKVIADLRRSLDGQLDEAIAKNLAKEEFIESRRTEIHKLIERLSREPASGFWHQVIRAELTPNMISAIATMTWRFLFFDSKPVFFTCDNPVFFFPEMGIGKAESELCFPISGHIMLWATRRPNLSEGYFPATMTIVKEMTRRIASCAARYIFHALEEDWILSFLRKGKWRLNLIH
jgi:hypothetical protein